MEENYLNSQSNQNNNNINQNNINYSNNKNINLLNNNILYPNQNINKRKSPNDFIFLCDELHIYREMPGIGKFSSYKNKSVKGIFNDKTICMMNNDQFYAKIINKYGEKDIVYIP